MKNPFKRLFQPEKKRAPHIYTCGVCKETMMEGSEIVVVTHYGRGAVQDLVCSKVCERKRYSKYLRLGL